MQTTAWLSQYSAAKKNNKINFSPRLLGFHGINNETASQSLEEAVGPIWLLKEF